MGRDDNDSVKTEDVERKIAGIVLAAGYSARMGSFKPLLPVGERLAIQHVIDSLAESGANPIVVVTGYQSKLLTPVLDRYRQGFLESNGPVLIAVFNPDYEKGMFLSIQSGLSAALTAGAQAFLLLPVDYPLVSTDICKILLEKHRQNPEAFLVPTYHGKKGHPLLIPACHAEEILNHVGEGGLKAITSKYEENFIRLEIDQEEILLDMDTPEDYLEILEFQQNHERKAGKLSSGNQTGNQTGSPILSDVADWEMLLSGRRLILIRHGETVQHSGKILLGQTDLPLSEKGKDQALQTAKIVKELHIKTDRIYSSDLIRATKTAEIIAAELGKLARKTPGSKDVESYQLIKRPALREMNLGQWDGRLISEIKELYPEEFEKRGNRILTYKFGNDAENFYDLQYRVIKELKAILVKDCSSDIVIVAHTGVIKTICSNVRGSNLSEELLGQIPHGGITILPVKS